MVLSTQIPYNEIQFLPERNATIANPTNLHQHFIIKPHNLAINSPIMLVNI